MTTTSDVIFRISDLRAAKDFYRGSLGFAVVKDTENMVGFDTGNLTLYFERGDLHGAVFEFEVDDVSRAKEQLLAQGCTLVEEDPALPRCYLRDPFGLTFNLTPR